MTQKELKRLFGYDPDTGRLLWREEGLGRHKGKMRPAGCATNHGYIQIIIEGQLYRAHRLVWLWNKGYLPEGGLDHIDRDKTNNRIENLRHVSMVCNLRNTGNFKSNKSGVKGVCWFSRTNKWSVQVKVSGKKKHLGYFEDFDEAVAHRLAAEQCLDWEGCDVSSPAFKHINSFRG